MLRQAQDLQARRAAHVLARVDTSASAGNARPITDVFTADKQTELLGRVSGRYGLPPQPPEFQMAQYNTLGKIADLILTSAA